MSVHAASLDHRLYVLLAVFTHGAIGFTLASVLTDDHPAAGVVGAVLPDVDLLFAPAWQFPLVHRGVTHTLLFGGFVVGVSLAVPPLRRVAPGVALGYLSHLVVDTLTSSGVMWLYPLLNTSYAVDASIHAVERTVAIWTALLAVLLFDRRRRDNAKSRP
ncbi:MAG: metal-dependent hydrolase [Halobacteriota archaeon]